MASPAEIDEPPARRAGRRIGCYASLVMLAIIVAGAAVVKRMRAEVFYPIVYALIFLLSLKLIWDGALAVW